MRVIISIVIVLFILFVIIALGGFLLFHPIVNSVFTAIASIFLWVNLITRGDLNQSGLAFSIGLILIVIILADCIRDIAIGKKYYRKFEMLQDSDVLFTLDKLFVIKSLTSLLTGGCARIIFLFIVGPYLSRTVMVDVQRKMETSRPLPSPVVYSKLQAKNYYYAKQLEKLNAENMFVSNAETVDCEIQKRQERLDGLYPKKIVEKLTEKLGGNKEVKEARQSAEKKLWPDVVETYYAYLNTCAYEQFPQLISEVMMNKGCLSPSDIQKLKELKGLNLMSPINGKEGSTDWGEYFIIQALQPLVENGTFTDEGALSDRDAFETHAYQHTNTSKPRKSQSPETNPALMLDDDD